LYDQAHELRGNQTSVASISLPEEPIQDKAAEVAVSIWHLRDPLVQWNAITRGAADVDELVKSSNSLLLCRDLANMRKHLRNENASGRDPRIGLVTFDTSRSGVIELAYDGISKAKALLVTLAEPLYYRVNLNLKDAIVQDAFAVFDDAMRHWIPIIGQIGILSSAGAENLQLLGRLNSLMASPKPPILEIPTPLNYEHG